MQFLRPASFQESEIFPRKKPFLPHQHHQFPHLRWHIGEPASGRIHLGTQEGCMKFHQENLPDWLQLQTDLEPLDSSHFHHFKNSKTRPAKLKMKEILYDLNPPQKVTHLRIVTMLGSTGVQQRPQPLPGLLSSFPFSQIRSRWCHCTL